MKIAELEIPDGIVQTWDNKFSNTVRSLAENLYVSLLRKKLGSDYVLFYSDEEHPFIEIAAAEKVTGGTISYPVFEINLETEQVRFVHDFVPDLNRLNQSSLENEVEKQGRGLLDKVDAESDFEGAIFNSIEGFNKYINIYSDVKKVVNLQYAFDNVSLVLGLAEKTGVIKENN